MHKARFLIILLGVFWLSAQAMMVFAQEEDDDSDSDGDYIDSEYDDYVVDPYAWGDQTFTITLGVIFPTVFYNNGKEIPHHFNPPVGGAGSLAYTYFFGAHFFVGGEIGINFNYTLAENVVFLIPIGLKTGWQFSLGRFEFPVYFSMGIAPTTYLNDEYAGLFIKGGASGFFRFNSDWSFGLNFDWNWYPQRPNENGQPAPRKNIDANIIGLTLSARYHF